MPRKVQKSVFLFQKDKTLMPYAKDKRETTAYEILLWTPDPYFSFLIYVLCKWSQLQSYGSFFSILISIFNWHFYMLLLHFKWVTVERSLPGGIGSIRNLQTTQSPQSMESPVMRDLALWQCYSIIEQLMKKTTSSLLIPKIRFQLIKCHCWKGASSDLTKVSQHVASAPNGWSSAKLWEWEDKWMERERRRERRRINV